MVRGNIVRIIVLAIACLAGCAVTPPAAENQSSAEPSIEQISEIDQSLQACGTGLFCSLSAAAGATQCQSGSQVVFCCPFGFSIAGGSCLPNCPSGRSCGLSGTSGTLVCSQSFSNGSQTAVFCCAAGKRYTPSGCL